MRCLSWNDPIYALSILNAGITIAFIHGNNLRNRRRRVDGPEETVDEADALFEERFDFLERLNRGVAVEFLEISDMRRAYEAYKRSKGELVDVLLNYYRICLEHEISMVQWKAWPAAQPTQIRCSTSFLHVPSRKALWAMEINT